MNIHDESRQPMKSLDADWLQRLRALPRLPSLGDVRTPADDLNLFDRVFIAAIFRLYTGIFGVDNKIVKTLILYLLVYCKLHNTLVSYSKKSKYDGKIFSKSRIKQVDKIYYCQCSSTTKFSSNLLVIYVVINLHNFCNRLQ